MRSAVDDHRLKEHHARPNPQAPLTVQGAIDHERLLSLGMSGFTDDLVILSFLMTIAAWLDHRVSSAGSYISEKNGKENLCVAIPTPHHVSPAPIASLLSGTNVGIGHGSWARGGAARQLCGSRAHLPGRGEEGRGVWS